MNPVIIGTATMYLGDCMDMLPPLIESADIAGRVTEDVARETGLAAGTPVVGGLFDVVASALGSGVSRTGSASVIAGTFDDGSRSHGIAGLTAERAAGINIKEVGEKEDADESITRVVWYCGVALFSEKGLAILSGVTN